MKSVFIFGAGASRAAGAPLMSDFLDKAADLMVRGPRGLKESHKHFENVFSAISDLRTVHHKSFLDFDNIETVFGAIEMALLLRKLGNLKQNEIEELRSSLVTLIFKTLEYSITFHLDEHNRPKPPSAYDQFANIIKKFRRSENDGATSTTHNFSYITFNYDVSLDLTLDYIGQPYDYHLRSGALSRNSTSPLLKLHGSINWGLSESGAIVPWPLNMAQNQIDKFGEKCFFDCGSKLNLFKHENRPLRGPPVIVPPTWNKNEYHGQLSNVWAAAANELSEAENIFVIGYSLPETDSFFRYLYALGSDSNSRLRHFVVVNTDRSGEVEKRFKNLIGRGVEKRFKILRATFADSVRGITSILEHP